MSTTPDEAVKSLKSEQYEIDRKVAEYSIRLSKPFYDRRREIVNKIPRFWAIVIGETEPLRPYITFDDSLAFDASDDVFISYDSKDSRNFEIFFSFGDNPHFSSQTLTKKLIWIDEGVGAGYYTSPQDSQISWKDSSNLITQHLHGEEESFFTWFAYTTTENVEDRRENTIIAQLLRDEIYPSAIEFYEAAQDDQDVEEEYDISEDE